MKTFIAIILVLFIGGSSPLNGQQIDEVGFLTIQDRESHIQNALGFRTNGDFSSAIRLLDSILLSNPQDAPVLLLKGDILLESKQFSDAVRTYNSIIPLDYNKVIVQINLSYALFMSHKTSKALEVSKNAWQHDTLNVNAIINHFNAMLWNGKVKLAKQFLIKESNKLSQEQIILLKARLSMVGMSYKDGLKLYGELMEKYPNANYAKEYIDVLLGRKEYNQADTTLLNAQGFISIKEFDSFKEKLRVAQYQNAGFEYSNFEDIANNVHKTKSLWWSQRGGENFNLNLRVSTTNSMSNNMNESTSNRIGMSIDEKWGMSLRGTTELTFNQNSFREKTNYTSTSFKQTIQYQPGNRFMMGMLYNSDLLSYSVEQLQERIRNNQVGAYTHLLLNSKNGFYGQGSWGRLSDGNSQIQFFGSLYHTFQTNPLLKVGVNYSTLSFKKNASQRYFSPLSYNSGEIFIDYNTTIPGINGLSIKLQSGYGMQKIERNSWESAFRFQSELSLRLKHIETTLRYQTSNIASSTGTGYKYSRISFRVAWNW